MPMRIPGITTDVLNISGGTGFASTVKTILDYLRREDVWGSAAFVDIGNGDNDITTNGNLESIIVAKIQESGSILAPVLNADINTLGSAARKNIASITNPISGTVPVLDTNAKIPELLLTDSVKIKYNETIFAAETNITGTQESSPTNITLQINTSIKDLDNYAFITIFLSDGAVTNETLYDIQVYRPNIASNRGKLVNIDSGNKIGIKRNTSGTILSLWKVNTLGPTTNTFSGATRSEAEAARDTHAAANSDWLAQYNYEPAYKIALTFGGETIYQYRRFGEWVDYDLKLMAIIGHRGV